MIFIVERAPDFSRAPSQSSERVSLAARANPRDGIDVHRTPGSLAILAGNVEVPDSQNVRVVVPFTKSFNFLTITRVEKDATLLAIFLGELNGNNGAPFVVQEFAEGGWVHGWCSCELESV